MHAMGAISLQNVAKLCNKKARSRVLFFVVCRLFVFFAVFNDFAADCFVAI